MVPILSIIFNFFLFQDLGKINSMPTYKLKEEGGEMQKLTFSLKVHDYWTTSIMLSTWEEYGIFSTVNENFYWFFDSLDQLYTYVRDLITQRYSKKSEYLPNLGSAQQPRDKMSVFSNLWSIRHLHTSPWSFGESSHFS